MATVLGTKLLPAEWSPPGKPLPGITATTCETRCPMSQPVDVADLGRRLLQAGYVADAGLATALACAVSLERAVLLEGDAGVGKTDAARALAAVFGARLIRLQCYEGLDLAAAAYDWNYGKQLLAIRAAEAAASERPTSTPTSS